MDSIIEFCQNRMFIEASVHQVIYLSVIKYCEDHAKEMGIAENEIRYSDGYKEGYNRALELTQWAISNLVPPHNDKQ